MARTDRADDDDYKVTLHAEIAEILRASGTEWMTTQEIADQVNARGRYHKKDGSEVTDFQIHGRTRNYSNLFDRDGSRVRLRVVEGTALWNPETYHLALRFAAERHSGQTVPGTSLPYLVHVTSVAAEVMRGIALEPVENPDLAIGCALLHDVLEDTKTKFDEVSASFGADIAGGVAALSKNKLLPKTAQLEDSLARIRARPMEVWVVKLADRIVNLQPPPKHWDGAKRRAYQTEARRIHEALASAHGVLGHRLAEMIEAYSAFLDPRAD